jgi:hypothetical protein
LHGAVQGVRRGELPAPTAARDTIALVKRSLAWFAGIVGIAALGRMLSRRKASGTPIEPAARPTPAVEETAVDPAADPAEELRRKLAAARQPEPPAEPEVVETLDERRARVHAKAREAMDAMNDEGPAA